MEKGNSNDAVMPSLTMPSAQTKTRRFLAGVLAQIV
jgi:hypothetical protein